MVLREGGGRLDGFVGGGGKLDGLKKKKKKKGCLMFLLGEFLYLKLFFSFLK